MDLVDFNGNKYPKFQTEGNAAQFIRPFALKFCKGIGYDIGFRDLSWKLPGAIPVDPVFDDRYHAMNLPYESQVDFIFSSHCLEHVKEPWFTVLKYWYTNLKESGIMFLYLPDYSQEYWRPWNNTKHVHILTPTQLKDAFLALKMKHVFVSGIDLNNSFCIVGEK